MKLTNEEKIFIKNNEKMIESVISVINAVKQFKEGDFLVAFHNSTGFSDHRRRPVVNSYGAVKKFQVVAVDKHGIPYMKELNKKGNPVGTLISSVKNDSNKGMTYNLDLTYNFEVDPDYTDAIILDDQANYNASNVLKMKSETFKEIAAHNKLIKVDCTDTKNLAAFLTTVKVGDLLWRSNISSWTVIDINPVPRDAGNKIQHHTDFMKVNTSKGKTISLCVDDVRRIALYTARPRTFKELKDPK